MSDCCTPKGYRQIFSEKNARGEAKRYRRKGLDGISRRIADLLKERDVDGRTLDFVVMNRVLCCYPDMPKLAAAAADHARSALVLSFPNSRWWTRFGLTVVNLGFRLFRVQFQVFMHSPKLILATVERHGFTTRFNQRGMVWQVAVLERTD